MLDHLVAELSARAGELAANGRALPGASEALTAVRAVVGVHQSVLTGNLYPLAKLKLATFGLDPHLDLRIGAFGGDALERTDLPTHAFDRTQRCLGRRFTGLETVIIGDTPRDIHTAQAVGAKAIGISTGTATAPQLWAAGADVVLSDLSDLDAVLDAVFCER